MDEELTRDLLQLKIHLQQQQELAARGWLADRTTASQPPVISPDHGRLPTTSARKEAVTVSSEAENAIQKNEEEQQPAPARQNDITDESLADIAADLCDCRRCRLAETRNKLVFGAGNPAADLMFVGEAPGGDEDKAGIPFVGRAGQLLSKIINAIDLTREEVYIANIIKCRPPKNRNPEADEIAVCSPFLDRQIRVIRPKVICALGKFAAQTMLNSQTPISKLRGRVHDYKGICALVPTFHPAYLLRNPSSKRETWEDMKLVMKILSGSDA